MRFERSLLVGLFAALLIGISILWYLHENTIREQRGDLLLNRTSSFPRGVFDRNVKKEQISTALSTLNDQEILFFGRAIDQLGGPVKEAMVVGGVIVKDGFIEQVKTVTTVTDSNGCFTIDKTRGRDIGITVTKPGYSFVATNTVFIFSHMWPREQRHIPNRLKPVEFPMWKLQGAEPLIEIDQRCRFKWQSDPFVWDFLQNKNVTSGGDLKITILRVPGVATKRDPKSWAVILEAVEGGLMEVNLKQFRTTLLAPINGYTNKLSININAEQRDWTDLVTKIFFLESRNQRVFAKFQTACRLNEAPDDEIEITFRGLANANGSRNWEEDPDKIKLP